MKGALLVALAAMALVTGCSSPEFTYNMPSASLDPSGPSIVVLPLADRRDNRNADEVFKKGYLSDVQDTIVRELQNTRMFNSVAVATNQEHLPAADLQLSPTLRRLDWEIPHHGSVSAAKAVGHTLNFIGNATLGLPAGNLVLHTGTPICGNVALDVTVRQTGSSNLLLNTTYSESVTNRVKKSDCDKYETKAAVMLAAFQTMELGFKTDLMKQLLQNKYAKPDPKAQQK